jgi:hypothetical protein
MLIKTIKRNKISYIVATSIFSPIKEDEMEMIRITFSKFYNLSSFENSNGLILFVSQKLNNYRIIIIYAIIV